MEGLPLSRTAALVPKFAVKDLPLGRILMMMMMMILLSSDIRSEGSIANVKKFYFDFL